MAAGRPGDPRFRRGKKAKPTKSLKRAHDGVQRDRIVVNVTFCEWCKKSAFDSQDGALARIAVIHAKEAGYTAPHRKLPNRAYECPQAPGTWHLTSQPLRTDEQIAEYRRRLAAGENPDVG